MVLPFVIGGTVIRRPLIRILSTERYVPAADSLPLFLIAAFFTSLNGLPYFLSQGRTRLRLGMSILTSILLLGGVAIGVQWRFFGAVTGYALGAGLVTTVNYAIILWEVGGISVRRLNLSQLGASLAVLAGLMWSIAGYITGPLTLMLGILVPGGSYCLLVFRLGVISSEEKRRLLEAAPKGRARVMLDTIIVSG